MPKIRLYREKGKKRLWRWQLIGLRGKKLCGPEEGFSSRRRMEENLAACKLHLTNATVVDETDR